MVIRFQRHKLFGQTGNAKEKKKPWYSFFKNVIAVLHQNNFVLHLRCC